MSDELKQSILKKITSGDVKKKSRAYFMTKSALLIVALSISFILALYVTSFVTYAITNSGAHLLYGFGLPGLKIAFITLPWVLILFIALLIISFEFFGKKFKFMYKQPFIVTGLLVLSIVTIGGIAIGQTSFHSKIEDMVMKKKMMPMKPMYERYGKMQHEDAHMGIVDSIVDGDLIINELNGNQYTVVMSDKTEFFTGNSLPIGERVMIIGPDKDGVIYATGVKVLMPWQVPRMRIGTSTKEHRPIWMK